MRQTRGRGALTRLADALPEPDKGTALEEASGSARDPGEPRATDGARPASTASADRRAEVLDAALHQLQRIPEDERADLLIELSSELPDHLLPSALTAASMIGEPLARRRAVATISGRMPGRAGREALEEVAATIESVGDQSAQVAALLELAAQLDDGEAGDVISEAFAVLAVAAPPGLEQARIIAMIVRRFARLLALPVALSLPDRPAIVERLKRRGRHGHEQLGVLADVANAALGTDDPMLRAMTLTEIAPCVPEPFKDKVVREALKASRSVSIKTDRITLLRGLIPILPQRERDLAVREAVDAVLSIDRFDLFSSELPGLADLMPVLPRPERDAAVNRLVELVPGIPPWDRSGVLCKLIPFLAEPARSAAIKDAVAATRWAFGSERQHHAGLLALVPEAERAAIIDEALEAAHSPFTADTAWGIEQIAPHLPESRLAEALGIAKTVPSDWERTTAVASLAPYLPDPLLAEAITILRAVPMALYGPTRSSASFRAYSTNCPPARSTTCGATRWRLRPHPAVLACCTPLAPSLR